MDTSKLPWAFRLCWVAVAFTAGAPISASLAEHGVGVRSVTTVGAWALWGIVLVASSVPHPITLTTTRALAPLAVVLCGWTAMQVTGWQAPLALVLSVVAVVIAATAAFGDPFIDAGSYGDERRFGLRPPLSLLIGPAVGVWAIGATGLVVGPLLLGAQRWLAGAIAIALGVPAAAWSARSLHGLSKRMLVFVPAGTTIVDPFTLVDSALLARRAISAFGPAMEGSTARDLSAGATGLILEIALTAPVEVTVRTGRSAGQVESLDAALIAPSRPAAVLAEAAARGIPTG